jgi:hypothetical protein
MHGPNAENQFSEQVLKPQMMPLLQRMKTNSSIINTTHSINKLNIFRARTIHPIVNCHEKRKVCQGAQ